MEPHLLAKTLAACLLLERRARGTVPHHVVGGDGEPPPCSPGERLERQVDALPLVKGRHADQPGPVARLRAALGLREDVRHEV